MCIVPICLYWKRCGWHAVALFYVQTCKETALNSWCNREPRQALSSLFAFQLKKKKREKKRTKSYCYAFTGEKRKRKKTKIIFGLSMPNSLSVTYRFCLACLPLVWNLNLPIFCVQCQNLFSFSLLILVEFLLTLVLL